MMVKAHENCAFLRTVFWSFGYFCRKKTKKGWAVDCKSLHKSKKCLTSLIENFDVIVVGAGHAGVEASLAAARIGM